MKIDAGGKRRRNLVLLQLCQLPEHLNTGRLTLVMSFPLMGDQTVVAAEYM